MPTWVPIITLSFIVLLPVFPAYLLFRALPSTGKVEGKFQGMEIKLGGSFAGYFALVLLVLHSKDMWNPPAPKPSAYVWHLSGQVIDSNGNPIEQLEAKDFAIDPPNFSTLPGGKFDLTISTEPRDGGGTKYPRLVLSHGSFVPFSIPLDDTLDPKIVSDLGIKRDDEHREITIQHIPLRSPAPYAPTGPAPERVQEQELAANRH